MNECKQTATVVPFKSPNSPKCPQPETSRSAVVRVCITHEDGTLEIVSIASGSPAQSVKLSPLEGQIFRAILEEKQGESVDYSGLADLLY